MPECNHLSPPYYDAPNGVTLEKIVHGFNLPFYVGNALKYLLRADHKENRAQDLKKARECLNLEIAYLESVRAVPISDCHCHAVARDAGPPVSQADGTA